MVAVHRRLAEGGDHTARRPRPGARDLPDPPTGVLRRAGRRRATAAAGDPVAGLAGLVRDRRARQRPGAGAVRQTAGHHPGAVQARLAHPTRARRAARGRPGRRGPCVPRRAAHRPMGHQRGQRRLARVAGPAGRGLVRGAARTLAGVRRDQLPQLVPPGRALEALRPDVARAIGLPGPVPLVAGLGDGQAAGLGAGVVEPGAAYLNLGTSMVLGTPSTQYLTGRAFRTLATAPAGTFVLETVLNAAAYLADWFRRELGDPALGSAPDPVLEQAAAAVPPGAQGLLAVPYWNAAQTPYWDPHARGVLLGCPGRTPGRTSTAPCSKGSPSSCGCTSRGSRPPRAQQFGRSGRWVAASAARCGPRSSPTSPGAVSPSATGSRSAPAVPQCSPGWALACPNPSGPTPGQPRMGRTVWRSRWPLQWHDGARRYCRGPELTAHYERLFAVQREIYPRLREVFAELAALQPR